MASAGSRRRHSKSKPLVAWDSASVPPVSSCSYVTTVLTRDKRFTGPARSDCGVDEEDDSFQPLVPLRMHWLPTEEAVFFGEPDAITCLCLCYTLSRMVGESTEPFVNAAYTDWYEAHEAKGCVAPPDDNPRAVTDIKPLRQEWPVLARIHGWRFLRARTERSTLWLFQHAGVLVELPDAHCLTAITNASAALITYQLEPHVATDDERRSLARKYTLGLANTYAPESTDTYEVAERPATKMARTDRGVLDESERQFVRSETQKFIDILASARVKPVKHDCIDLTAVPLDTSDGIAFDLVNEDDT